MKKNHHTYETYNNYYEDMINIICPLHPTTLKGNPYLEKALITGCLRVSKESIFAGLNNLNVYSLTDGEYTSVFGFTKDDVENDYIALTKKID